MVGGPFTGSAHRLSEHWENPIMNKAELIEAATALGIEVPPAATKPEIEKLIEAVTPPADTGDAVEPEGDASPVAAEPAPDAPVASEMLTYDAEVASLVAVVTADCSTPFDNTFITLKTGQEVEGPLAAALVAAGLAEPKD